MSVSIHAPIIEMPPNSTIYVRVGTTVYSISDWGDALMGGGRGPLVIESAEEKELSCEFLNSDGNSIVIEHTGLALCFGEVDE